MALVISAELLDEAGLERLAAPTRSITIRGRRDPLAVALFNRIDDLPGWP